VHAIRFASRPCALLRYARRVRLTLGQHLFRGWTRKDLEPWLGVAVGRVLFPVAAVLLFVGGLAGAIVFGIVTAALVAVAVRS
jgi:hypothetical protein